MTHINFSAQIFITQSTGAPKCRIGPNVVLQKCLQKILEYLSTTKSLGITYVRHPSSTPILSGFADASFASEDECLSRVGYFYLFKGNLVFVGVRKYLPES